ncbi:MAG: PQQ-dependent sugar dehydrogenase [Actinomycetota bacterium]|nr:PQQ-dependent sugar dehydrogenase [Actinomycetota bacterium]
MSRLGIARRACFVVLLVLATGCVTSYDPLADPSLLLGDPASRGQVRLEPIGAFEQPVQVISPPGDRRLFVVERTGRVKIWIDDEVLETPFLDVSHAVTAGPGRGLLSIAFPPDHRWSRLLYVSYTDRLGNNQIDEYAVDPSSTNRVDPRTRRPILVAKQISPVNNGGLIGFDSAGMLLIGTGDDGLRAPAQDPTDLRGKFLRIDPRKPSEGRPYSIPHDNPFVGVEGIRAEIWAYGLRNPWRWAFDPGTQDLYVADVRESDSAPIYFIRRELQPGANYGWARHDSPEPLRGRLVEPILTYPLSRSQCAIVGGGVYRGSVAGMRGVYTYGDFCQGAIKGFRVNGGAVAEEVRFKQLAVPELIAFGEDSDGEMYVVSLKGGVFRLAGGRS